jgi:hypothetical protein
MISLKNIIIIFSLFGLTIKLNAQNSLISEIEIFGGPSLSNYWGKYRPKDQVVNLTYFYGAGVSHKFNGKLEISGKLLFEQKGNKMQYVETFYDDNNVPTTSEFVQGSELDYLTFLVYLNYYLDKRDRFYAGFGGFLSSLSKSMTYTEVRSLQGGVISYYYANDDSFNDFDYGLSTMVGYKIPFRPKLIFNIRLIGSMGLSDIVKSEIPTEGPTKCFNLLLSVGFTFKL